MRGSPHTGELPRARVRPQWPFWVLASLTPVVHLLWVALVQGVASPAPSANSWTVLTAIGPTVLAFALATAVTVWYRLEHRDIDRSILLGAGWQFLRRTFPAHDARFSVFPAPGLHGLPLTNIAWGPLDDHLCASYTLWTSPAHRYCLDTVELPAALPSMVLVPHRWVDRDAFVTELARVPVPSQAFNERWQVFAANPDAAQAVLSSPLIQAMLSEQMPLDAGVTIDGATVIVWSPGVTKPQQLRRRLDAARAIAAAIPQGAYEQFATSRPAWWGPSATSEWVSPPSAQGASSYRTPTLDEEFLAFTERAGVTRSVGPFFGNRQANERLWTHLNHNRALLKKSDVGYARLMYGGITAVLSAVAVPMALMAGLWGLAPVPLIGVLLGIMVTVSGVRRIADASGRPRGDVWMAMVSAAPAPSAASN